jgi:hypothetical protein
VAFVYQRHHFADSSTIFRELRTLRQAVEDGE